MIGYVIKNGEHYVTQTWVPLSSKDVTGAYSKELEDALIFKTKKEAKSEATEDEQVLKVSYFQKVEIKRFSMKIVP